ncbi:hypothetical protein HA402_003607 [Bradysia odoriphaga]|nr:hypothetical protein HA402_003607 [Bradysia odoriphaga]
MAPFTCNKDAKENKLNAWNLDRNHDYWEPVTRKSSFSDINQLTLRTARNSLSTSGYAREFHRYLKHEKRRLQTIDRHRQFQYQNSITRSICWVWKHKFNQILDDWLTLAMLGICMAFLSVGVDKGITLCLRAREWLYRDLTTSLPFSYICWIVGPTILILFAVTFVRVLAPQSVGSGIPEVKTILRGFPIENHLTFKTLVAKLVGLTATLGSGLPLGKEAPFVHISCIVARLLSKMMSFLRGTQPVSEYNTDTLVAGCAVGIAACFASPIGGVLYSIEATSTYFAVRNYWRAFFAAVCTALFFRLHAVWTNETDTITALFATNFTAEFPFDPQELFIFALIGVICGFLSSLWVWFYRQYSIFIKTNKIVLKMNQISFLLYPFIMVVVISFISYPFGFCHVANHLSTHDQVTQLFSNFTWGQSNLTEAEARVVANWTNGNVSFIPTLVGYFIYTFIFSAMGSTIAVPSGSFIPVVKLGACLGRLIGESIHLWFPAGVYFSERLSPVIPGKISLLVGAASFAGGTTHTLSVAVMALEMTGQISLLAPIMISLLVSNAIAVHLCPSIYDTIIALKKLPYLPDPFPSKHQTEEVIVKDFMVKDVYCIWYGMTYNELQNVLMETENVHHLPLVENKVTMILLGSVERTKLVGLVAKQISREKRLQTVTQWQKENNVRTRSRRFSHVETKDVMDNVNFVRVNRRQSDGLKNRRTSNIVLADLGYISGLYDVIDNAKSDGDGRLPLESQNTDTITSNSSDNTILEHLNESTKLLKIAGPTILKKVHIETMSDSNNPVIDMSQNDQKRWEAFQLNKTIDFDYETVEIDPAPFQLVEKTPITNVHRLFTVLSLRRAYVTQLGKLIGVVGLDELRLAIENSNNGKEMVGCARIGSSSVVVVDETSSDEDDDVEDGSVSTDVEKAH